VSISTSCTNMYMLGTERTFPAEYIIMSHLSISAVEYELRNDRAPDQVPTGNL